MTEPPRATRAVSGRDRAYDLCVNDVLAHGEVIWKAAWRSEETLSECIERLLANDITDTGQDAKDVLAQWERGNDDDRE